jgi:predicted small lipoprotein YifL
MKPMRLLSLLAAILAIAGCGTKTPLTLPPPAQPAAKGAAVPTPPPAAAAGKVAEPGR